MSMASNTTKTARGALVVLEGLDRAGKSSQCQLLHEKLQGMGIPVRLVKFPGSPCLGRLVRRLC